jgi:hypothetical protein
MKRLENQVKDERVTRIDSILDWGYPLLTIDLVQHHVDFEEFARPRANGICGCLTPQHHSGRVLVGVVAVLFF